MLHYLNPYTDFGFKKLKERNLTRKLSTAKIIFF